MRAVPPEWTVAATARELPNPPLLHKIVAPPCDDPALFDGERRLSYAELNWAANALALRLRESGVGTGSIVALVADRSIDWVIAALATLKAGGAFAPVDPAAAAEATEDVLAGLDCPVVLVDDSGTGRVRGRTTLNISGTANIRAPRSPRIRITPDALAYVMHTSGTTGRPKAVLITHRGAVNFVQWISRAFPLPAGTSVLQWTPTVFDPSVWELWWPLMLGRQSVLAAPRAHADIDAVVDLAARDRVASLHFTPATLAAFLDAPGVWRCRDLTYLFCSGEAIPAALVERALRLTSAPVVNLYGATEVSVDSTCHTAGTVPGEDTVPAGRPLDNTGVYVLDDELRPVPDGERGEVYLGGESVARGYLNRPALTAARFMPDPFGRPGQRMYRTGDIGARGRDGELRVFGRRDGQLKIRGVRIELAGVEAVTTEDPAVRACVAVAHGSGMLQRVVAYVVPAAGAELDQVRLRERLRRRLPAAALPASITVLDELPLSPTGKVDRTALPAPGADTHDAASDPPRTESESLIALLWRDVLGAGSVNRTDQFVELGGDSLHAARVTGELERRTGVRVPPSSWQSAGTVAALAEALETARGRIDAADAELLRYVNGLREDEVRALLADLPD